MSPRPPPPALFSAETISAATALFKRTGAGWGCMDHGGFCLLGHTCALSQLWKPRNSAEPMSQCSTTVTLQRTGWVSPTAWRQRVVTTHRPPPPNHGSGSCCGAQQPGTPSSGEGACEKKCSLFIFCRHLLIPRPLPKQICVQRAAVQGLKRYFAFLDKNGQGVDNGCSNWPKKHFCIM